jgi:hypothetical protein
MPEPGGEEPRESCEPAASGENSDRGISWSTMIQCRLRSAGCAPRGCGEDDTEEDPAACAVTSLDTPQPEGVTGVTSCCVTWID